MLPYVFVLVGGKVSLHSILGKDTGPHSRHVVDTGDHDGQIFQHHEIVGEISGCDVAVEHLASERETVPVRAVLQIAELFAGEKSLRKGEDEDEKNTAEHNGVDLDSLVGEGNKKEGFIQRRSISIRCLKQYIHLQLDRNGAILLVSFNSPPLVENGMRNVPHWSRPEHRIP
jgi:hypothetical protein